MKSIVRAVLCLTMIAWLAAPAQAFVFTDASALAQRAAQFIQTAQHYVASVTHYRQVVDYAQQFNQFRNQFNTYWNTYNRIHRRVTSGQYTSAFDVTKWNWSRLDDHIIRTWRSYNRAFWDAQQLALMTNQLIQTNPAYRAYVDRLVHLKEEKITNLQANEAMLEELEQQNRDSREALIKLEARNKELTTNAGGSTDPMDTAQLQSLNNLVMLEQTSILAREAAIRNLERKQEEEARHLAAELRALEIELKRDAFDEGWGFFLNFADPQRR